MPISIGKNWSMSRCEKLTTVACLILVLLGLIRLYQIQHTASNTSLHLLLQPQILPAAVDDAKLEDQEEETRSSLIVSETTSSVAATYYSSSDSSTTSETYSTYSSTSEETTSAESTESTESIESTSSAVEVVFYNRSSTFSLHTYFPAIYPGSQRLVQKTWHSSSSSLPSRMSSSKSGSVETVEVRWQKERRRKWKETCAADRSRPSSMNTFTSFPPHPPVTIPSPGSQWWAS